MTTGQEGAKAKCKMNNRLTASQESTKGSHQDGLAML